jgi:hypothetical protein
MPRNSITKDEIKIKILKLKSRLQKEQLNQESKNVTEKYLNEVLFIIEQYYR